MVEIRAKICDSCPHKKLVLCTMCGCVVAAKIRIKEAKCPIGNW